MSLIVALPVGLGYEYDGWFFRDNQDGTWQAYPWDYALCLNPIKEWFGNYQQLSLEERFRALPLGEASSVNPFLNEIVEVIPDPVYPVQVNSYNYTSKGPNPNFYKRRAQGLIVGRDLHCYEIKIVRKGVRYQWDSAFPIQSYTPIPFYWKFGDDSLRLNSRTVSVMGADRYLRESPYPGAPREADSKWANLARQLVKFKTVETSIPSSEAADLLFSRILDTHNSQPQDTDLVTAVLGRANSGSWDILTSLMEFSETVRYLETWMKRVYAVIQLFRGKYEDAVRLFNSKTERPFPRRPFDGPVSKKNYVAYRMWRNDIKKWHQERKVQKRQFLDRLAAYRLEFEYAFMPLKYELDSIIRALKKIGRTYQKYKQGKQETTTIETHVDPMDGTVYRGKLTIKTDHRCWLKRGYGAMTFLEGLFEVASLNIAVTALELTPYLGIVINWFTNINDYLAAQSFVINYEQQLCMYIKRTTVVGSLESETKGTLELSGRGIYTGKIIIPQDALACRPSDNFSLDKAINGFALAWMALRPNLHLPVNYTR